MGDAAQIQFDTIPSFLGVPVGDLEDLVPGQVAIAGYFCDNLDRPAAGNATSQGSCDMPPDPKMRLRMQLIWGM